MNKEDLPFDVDKMFKKADEDGIEEFGYDPEMDGLDPNFEAPKLDAPDLVGVIEGWRAWRVAGSLRPFEKPKLYSVSHGEYYWKPREFSQATCNRCGEEVPGEKCSCGFYTARTLPHLLSMGYARYYGGDDDDPSSRSYTVVGRVANWGKVIPGQAGWRAQKAYPVKLWVPWEVWKIAEPIEQTYGVPVGLLNWNKSVAEICEELGIPNSQTKPKADSPRRKTKKEGDTP